MDRIDRSIIEILKEDARKPNIDIAHRLKLSEATVRRRIAKLVSEGSIKRFTLEIDDSELTSAITWVSVSPSMPTSQVSGRIRKVPGVELVYETAGQFDIAVIIQGLNLVEVNKSVEEVRRLEGVINTNTMMILRIIH